MAVFFISLLLFLLVFAALALKTLCGRPGIKGSCGGHQGLGQKLSCAGCACSDETKETSVKALTRLR